MKRIALSTLVLAAIVVAGLPLFAQAPAGWGNIKGRIVWGDKQIPVRMPIPGVDKNADKMHCLSKGPLLSEMWVVNPKNRGLRDTFVWLINLDPKNKAPLPIHPDLKQIKKPEVEIDQPTCAFVPHALAMREGQILLAKNSSPVTHNIKWTGSGQFPGNSGNINLPAGTSYKIKGLVAQKLPLQIECNIHPWMNARLGVYDHPYFAVTDADGTYEIKNAPAGKYRVMIYNNSYLGGVKGRFGQEIDIPANGTLDMGEVAFSPPQ